MIRVIENAQHEILLESYIFNLDLIGERVFSSLVKARQRGVSVRVLVDGIGSFNWLKSLQGRALSHSIDFRIYHPLPFQFGLIAILSWKSLRRLLLAFRRVNRRNHRKTLIVDGRIVQMGSYNISQVHSERVHGHLAWNDCGVLVVFEAQTAETLALKLAFLRAWKRSNIKQTWLQRRSIVLPKNSQSLFRLNDTFFRRHYLSSDLKSRLRQSKKRVLIINPYFLPRRSQMKAILKAARRGVYVGLCVPAKSDVRIVQLASRYLYRELVESGVHVFEYRPRVLHAKVLVIDDWATVGSQNFNHRSFLHDLESEVQIQDPKILAEILSMWDRNIQNSEALGPRNFEKNTFLENFLGKIIFKMRYWL